MTTTTFGEHLKREREMRGVSLDEIATATRIGTRFLAALENEQWDRLPGGVFNRGFVRAVGRYLGLDEESLLAEYALAVDDRGGPPVWTGAELPRAPRTNWAAWILAAILLALLAGGAWAVWRRHVAKRPAASSAVNPAAAAPMEARIPPPQPPATADPASVASTSASPGAAEGEPNSAESIAEPSQLELKLQAGKSTIVSVTADGEKVFDGRINAGETRQFTARERFEVSAGDSAALLLELNGQVLPPLGTPGQPGKATLTRKDLKKNAGGPD